MPKRKWLTKIQVEKFSSTLLDFYKQNVDHVLGGIKEKVSSEPHINNNASRQEICETILKPCMLIDMITRYSQLYQECFAGRFGDRYAMLQMKWINHVAQYITEETVEHGLLLQILRCDTYDTQDISAVVHSFASYTTDHIHGFMIHNKPSKLCELNDSHPVEDSNNSLLAFGGACMRLIYKSAKKRHDDETMLLIRHLKLGEKQRNLYLSWGILSSSSLSTLYTIPVPALVPYLRHLNVAIQDNGTEAALGLYLDKFIKVALPFRIQWSIWGDSPLFLSKQDSSGSWLDLQMPLHFMVPGHQ